MDFDPEGLPELGLPELQLIAYGDFSHRISTMERRYLSRYYQRFKFDF